MGGYASASVAGALTRRYHGILVASLPAPLGRTILLNQLSEEILLHDGRGFSIGSAEYASAPAVDGTAHLADFTLDAGLPVWRYELDGVRLEKRLLMPRLQNSTYITYRITGSTAPVRLRLKPSLHFRNYEDPVSVPTGDPYSITIREHQCEISTSGYPPLRLRLYGEHESALHVAPRFSDELHYRVERARGYESAGRMWSPGEYEVTLATDGECTFVASAEPWNVIDALSPAQALAAELERRTTLLSLSRGREGADSESRPAPPADTGGTHDVTSHAFDRLLLAADQFIIVPTGRTQDRTRAEAAGDEVRTVIAGYHWFTDWGRDTMISLEGLTLTSGRWREAGYILRTFGYYVKDGLIPNMFPDQGTEGLYHTADATLWFFHALERYHRVTTDVALRDQLLPVMRDIADHHLRGTRFNIHVDPADGLLVQGEEGYQLTWMDAKADGWVVTPRRGKAVEINALWYNALMLLSSWLRDSGDAAAADVYAQHAERARTSFNARFWYDAGNHLYDVVDGENGDDAQCRPNQIFALSLDHPVLDREHWGGRVRNVFGTVSQSLGSLSRLPRSGRRLRHRLAGLIGLLAYNLG
jgi:glycogen debranching enzyme